MRILKISGHEIQEPQFLRRFAAAVCAIAAEEPTVIVNGGGKSIKAYQERLGLAEVKVDGLRVTDAPSLEITEMVMSGLINKLIVRGLVLAGARAVGISGVDAGLLRAEKKIHATADLGFVGEIVAVETDLIGTLLENGYLPVVSPVSMDAAGQRYNVNGDEAATAVAAALAADQLDFISNVPGVLRNLADTAVIPSLTVAEAEDLIADGTVGGGMIPKVKAALAAVAAGVGRARIVDLDGLENGGTVFQ